MDHTISKSEKKRRAKGIENLTQELLKLSRGVIKKLPCDEFIKGELLDAQGMKAGAKKRQVKYITKYLRKQNFSDELFSFMAEQKGSKLKDNREFHELESLRDDIITEAIHAQREAAHLNAPFDSGWHSKLIESATESYIKLDKTAVKTAAIRFAKSRKQSFSREIFRMLKAAQDQQRFINQEVSDR